MLPHGSWVIGLKLLEQKHISADTASTSAVNAQHRMSVDLTAIFPHSLDAAGVTELPVRLNHDRELPRLMRLLTVAAYGSALGWINSIQWKWGDDQVVSRAHNIEKAWGEGEVVTIIGPVGWLRVARDLCYFETFFRVTAAADTEIGPQIRCSVEYLHTLTNLGGGSCQALYVPDSATEESRIADRYDLTFPELIKWSSTEFGAPLACFEAMTLIASDGTVDVCGYALETSPTPSHPKPQE